MSRLSRWARPQTIVRAHCDIPCGIYDPHEAQLAARTVARMVELINQNLGSDEAARHSFARCVAVKEQHAEKIKHEVRIIWGDYFKPEHVERYPELHAKVWNIMKLASKNRQTIDAKAASDLEAAVNEFAEIFWATKK